MSAFGKVSFTENDNVAVEKVQEEIVENSIVDKQVQKFDTNYNLDKLQELYNEYDKITIDEDKVRSLTQIKTNAVTRKVSFRLGLAMGTTIVVAVLLAFLCIYNIFVINGMSNSIGYLQEEVIACEESLTQVEGIYNSLTNSENIEEELKELGYTSDFASSNIVAIPVPDKVEVEELQGGTNWFDSICNFLSQIFG